MTAPVQPATCPRCGEAMAPNGVHGRWREAVGYGCPVPALVPVDATTVTTATVAEAAGRMEVERG